MGRSCTRQHVWLRRLFPTARLLGCSDLAVADAACDSRKVQPGSAFVATPGTQADGRRFVPQAIAAGASVIVTESPLGELAVPQCVVADAREAFARLCQAVHGHPADRLHVVAVTGTNGKTTTATLTRAVLETAGFKTGLIGTVEQYDGQSSSSADMTTPDPDDLAEVMARMVEHGCTHAAMEVSSHALDQRRTAGIGFDVAVFTNLTHDHLDYHGTREAYAEAKGRLFRELGSDAWAVLNADDSMSARYAAAGKARVVRYAIHGEAELVAADVRLAATGSRFRMRGLGTDIELTTPLVGLHNVYNALAAAAVGMRYGLAADAIGRGIAGLSLVRGRLERVDCGQPYHVLVDYAHTPDAIERVLQGLRAVYTGRIVCVFGAGGDRDRKKRPEMARAAEAGADLVIVTSDNPRTEDPRAIIREIQAGFRDLSRVIVEPDRRTAIELALSQAQPGDCVLIAGKGHEQYQIVGERRLQFDDRTVAAGWIRSHGTEQRQPSLRRATA